MKGTATVALIATLLGAGCGNRDKPAAALSPEQQFEQMMNGVVLQGYSTRTGRQGLSEEERYYIDKVTRIGGDTWLFQARMRLGSREFPVPVPVTIKWAGDTPVITITDLSIPGFGSYTARVLLYRGQYAGTWSGKNASGEMFGKIIRQSE
ncbi:MAG: hypothetical protein IRZ15_07170 [Bryobacteraceae bacterium]|nr:hypothetical protein [Bryobacteraceae bacterium]